MLYILGKYINCLQISTKTHRMFHVVMDFQHPGAITAYIGLMYLVISLDVAL